MPAGNSTPVRWFDELRRRKVFRVVAVYLVIAWLVVQVADTIVAPLGLPEWSTTLVIVLVALGFPLACGLAWAFDVTAQGIERTSPAPTPDAARTSDAAPRSETASSTLPPAPAAASPSVAILPFLDLSPARDQEYFCDGIAEEIINALCCVRDLHVASRTSSFQFKGRQADVREIGRNLGVGAVLEGSVRKSGERVRITAQLVNSADGYHHWSESFDRRLDDVFDIQTEIARQLVRALRLTLTPLENALLGRGGTANAEAYDLYLRGQALLRDGTDTTLPQAALLFRQAIERDPGFAQALAGLANALAIKGVWRLDLTEAEFEEAFSVSRRALELQPHMPEAHVASACLLSMQGRAAEATLEFEAALRLNPASFEANYMYARHCFAQGEAEQARRLFEAAHRLRPDDYQPLCMLQGALEQLGFAAEITRGGRTCDGCDRGPVADRSPGWAGPATRRRAGRKARRRDTRARARGKAMLARPGSFATAYNLACAFAVLGDRERALEYLDAAVRYGRGNLGWIEHDTDFDEPARRSTLRIHRRSPAQGGTTAGSCPMTRIVAPAPAGNPARRRAGGTRVVGHRAARPADLVPRGGARPAGRAVAARHGAQFPADAARVRADRAARADPDVRRPLHLRAHASRLLAAGLGRFHAQPLRPHRPPDAGLRARRSSRASCCCARRRCGPASGCSRSSA